MIIDVLRQKSVEFGKEPEFEINRKAIAMTYRQGSSEKIISGGETLQVDALLTLSGNLTDGVVVRIFYAGEMNYYKVIGSNVSTSHYRQVKLFKIPAVKVVT